MVRQNQVLLALMQRSILGRDVLNAPDMDLLWESDRRRRFSASSITCCCTLSLIGESAAVESLAVESLAVESLMSPGLITVEGSVYRFAGQAWEILNTHTICGLIP
jgi:hypothetical protein